MYIDSYGYYALKIQIPILTKSGMAYFLLSVKIRTTSNIKETISTKSKWRCLGDPSPTLSELHIL